MYGRSGRQQLARAIYMNDLARHQALTRGGTHFAGWGNGETTRPPSQPLPAPGGPSGPIPSPKPTGPPPGGPGLPPIKGPKWMGRRRRGWGSRDIDVKRLDRLRGRGYQGYFGSGGGNFDAGFPVEHEVVVPDVYQEGSGPQLQQAYANRAERRKNALYGMALRAFMKLRKGIPLTDVEKRALRKVGGPGGLQEFFGPQGIDVESAAEEGHIVDLIPEDQMLAQEAVNGTMQLEGEEMSFATLLLIAGAVGGGIYLLGKALT